MPAGSMYLPRKLGIKRNRLKPQALGKVKHDVHALYRLAGGSLYQVIYGADNYRGFFLRVCPYAYVAEV